MVLIAGITSFAGQGVANDDVKTDDGEVYVSGVMQESACWLEMDSPWQNIELGNARPARDRLMKQRSTRIVAPIYLHDCPEDIAPGNSIALPDAARYEVHVQLVSDLYKADAMQITDVGLAGLSLFQPGGALIRNKNMTLMAVAPASEPRLLTSRSVPDRALFQFTILYQ
ncbi:hypothetical protein [Siccibacter turicensis]|uniref:Type 1 fimbrial protein n=1 Tax=Siccibacter turicensis TaxID=357233 RepID=A0A2P8VN07_9ENTR|nr:hypothetical protein [Siccibacter turicensis]PSN08941.1 hypothetical protein C7G83_06250 [Siccibacter turicensis]